jgi:serine/threonine protein kinase
MTSKPPSKPGWKERFGFFRRGRKQQTSSDSSTSAPSDSANPLTSVSASLGQTTTAPTSTTSAPLPLIPSNSGPVHYSKKRRIHFSHDIPDGLMDTTFKDAIQPELSREIYQLLQQKIPKQEDRPFIAGLCLAGESAQHLKVRLSISCCCDSASRHIESFCASFKRLQDFLRDFDVELDIFVMTESQQVPRQTSADVFDQTVSHSLGSCQLVIPNESTSLCGLKIDIGAKTGGSKHCTFGGLFVVRSKLVGLTTRHGFDSSAIYKGPSTQGGHFVKSDASAFSRTIKPDNMRRVAVFPWSSKVGEENQKHDVFDYDWQFLDISHFPEDLFISGKAINRANGDLVHGLLQERKRASGTVSILVSDKELISGELGSATTTVSFGAQMHNVHSILLSDPLPSGSSGAWVVQSTEQGNLLCGYVIGAQDDMPCAFMVPIWEALKNMKRVLGEDDIRLARPQDIQPDFVASLGLDPLPTKNNSSRCECCSIKNSKRGSFLKKFQSIWKHYGDKCTHCRIQRPLHQDVGSTISIHDSLVGLMDNLPDCGLSVKRGQWKFTLPLKQDFKASNPCAALGISKIWNSFPLQQKQEVESAFDTPNEAERKHTSGRYSHRPVKHAKNSPSIPQSVDCKLLITYNGLRIDHQDTYALHWMSDELASREVERILTSMARSLQTTRSSRSYIQREAWSICSIAPYVEVDFCVIDSERQRLNDVRQMIWRYCGERNVDFHLEIHVEISEIKDTLGTVTNPLQHLQALLDTNMRKNWQNLEYLPRLALGQIMTKEIISSLFRFADHSQLCLKDPGRKTAQGFVQTVTNSAVRLLAICVYAEVPLTCLHHLMSANIGDRSLPIAASERPASITEDHFSRLIAHQHKFKALDFDQTWSNNSFRNVPADAVLPIVCDVKQDRLGTGSFGEVYKVRLDPQHCDPDFQRTRTFVVKCSRSRNIHEDEQFSQEATILNNLSKVHHNHISVHAASWQQNGTLYVMYPYANGNLVQFLQKTPPPILSKDTVLTFINGLRDLSDALRHIHNFGSTGFAPLEAQDALSVPNVRQRLGFHADLKPENILVFNEGKEKMATWKISDFGLTRIAQTFEGASKTKSYFDHGGDYAAPEVFAAEGDPASFSPPGRASDIWSLGAIFSEMITWVLGIGPDYEDFKQERLNYDKTTFFWHVGDGKVQLKPPVRRLMDRLHLFCESRGVFEDMVKITEAMLDVIPQNRPVAAAIVNAFDALLLQAKFDLVDEDFYLLEKFNSFKIAAPPYQINDALKHGSKCTEEDSREHARSADLIPIPRNLTAPFGNALRLSSADCAMQSTHDACDSPLIQPIKQRSTQEKAVQTDPVAEESSVLAIVDVLSSEPDCIDESDLSRSSSQEAISIYEDPTVIGAWKVDTMMPSASTCSSDSLNAPSVYYTAFGFKHPNESRTSLLSSNTSVSNVDEHFQNGITETLQGLTETQNCDGASNRRTNT